MAPVVCLPWGLKSEPVWLVLDPPLHAWPSAPGPQRLALSGPGRWQEQEVLVTVFPTAPSVKGSPA